MKKASPGGRSIAGPLAGWEKPARLSQLDLFANPRDRMLVHIGVSIDEVERWRALGWISFDVREVATLDTGRVAEICFVRNLARAGLGDLQIARLLDELESPYLYDPVRTAYSFAFGWVQLPQPPTESEIDEFMTITSPPGSSARPFSVSTIY